MRKFLASLTPAQKFFAGAALQVLILLAIVAAKVAVLAGGDAVFLKIMPVDPRSPFRGDYLTFRYEISEVERTKFALNPVYGVSVYVPLEKSGPYFYQAAYPVSETPGALKGRLFIKGKIRAISEDKVGLLYGIEQYYIPENSGGGFEWSKESYAEVAVAGNGSAVIKKIYNNDKPFP